MKHSIGPYRVGEQVCSSGRFTVYAGRDTRTGAAVWIRRQASARRRPAEARELTAPLGDCAQLAVPVALAGDAGALLSIDAASAERAPVARAGTLAPDALLRAAYDLAIAVDAMHAAGFAHGGVGEWTVDVAADGSARLRGAAQATELDRTGARRDLCAVVALLERLAGGGVPGELGEMLIRLAAGRAGLAALIGLTGRLLGEPPREPAAVDEPRRAARRTAAAPVPTAGRHAPRHSAGAERDWRTLAAALALIVGVALGTSALWPSAGSAARLAFTGAPPSSGASAPAPVAVDWAEHLSALYATRAEAFAAGDLDMLGQIYTPGSAQLRADADTIGALVSQNRTVQGFAPKLLSVEAVQEAGEWATVVVRDEIAPFTILDESGTPMPVAGRAAAVSTLTLQRVAGVWLIDDAQRAT